MVKLRRSHLTILLLGVDQYGFMMRRQWLQEISTEHHPKVSQKIWTLPPHSYHSAIVLRTQSGNRRNMKLTAICLYFYGSFFQFCLLCWQGRYWLTDRPTVSQSAPISLPSLVSIFQFQDNFANFCPKSVIQWAGSMKNTNQSRWRLKSESLAVRFLNINYLEIWRELRMRYRINKAEASQRLLGLNVLFE